MYSKNCLKSKFLNSDTQNYRFYILQHHFRFKEIDLSFINLKIIGKQIANSASL